MYERVDLFVYVVEWWCIFIVLFELWEECFIVVSVDVVEVDEDVCVEVFVDVFE